MRRHGTRRLHIRIGLFAALAALLIVPAAAAGVHITAVDTGAFPLLRVTLVAPKGSATPRLREDGHPVVGMTAANLGQSKSIILALDRSQSMRGKPMTNALAAARHDWPQAIAWANKAAAIVPAPETMALLGDAYVASGKIQEA